MTRPLRTSAYSNRDLDLQGRSFSEAVIDDRNRWVAAVNYGAGVAPHTEEETKTRGFKKKSISSSGLA